jgi:hypothetical protein
MRRSISYRLLFLAAAIVVSLLPVTAFAKTAVQVHAHSIAAIQRPTNIAWD